MVSVAIISWGRGLLVEETRRIPLMKSYLVIGKSSSHTIMVIEIDCIG